MNDWSKFIGRNEAVSSRSDMVATYLYFRIIILPLIIISVFSAFLTCVHYYIYLRGILMLSVMQSWAVEIDFSQDLSLYHETHIKGWDL